MNLRVKIPATDSYTILFTKQDAFSNSHNVIILNNIGNILYQYYMVYLSDLSYSIPHIPYSIIIPFMDNNNNNNSNFEPYGLLINYIYNHMNNLKFNVGNRTLLL